MLVLTFAMVAGPRNAEADFWGSPVELTWTEPVEGPLYKLDHTRRPMRIGMWNNHGDYERHKMTHGQACGPSDHESQWTWFAVEDAEWNKNMRKYAVTKHVEGSAFQDYIFYKHTQRGLSIGNLAVGQADSLAAHTVLVRTDGVSSCLDLMPGNSTQGGWHE